jgi:hypothetical protein
VVIDKKARAFVKMTKTRQFGKPALPRAFTSEKHEIARAFYAKYDQNYGLRSRFSRHMSPPEKETAPVFAGEVSRRVTAPVVLRSDEGSLWAICHTPDWLAQGCPLLPSGFSLSVVSASIGCWAASMLA